MIKIDLNKKNKFIEFKPNQEGPTEFQIIFPVFGKIIINDDVWIFHRFVKQYIYKFVLNDSSHIFNFTKDYTRESTLFPDRRFRFEFEKNNE